MENPEIRVRRLDEEAFLPEYATDGSAGADLRALSPEPIMIRGGETVLIRTGLALEIPRGYAGLICARSGLATRQGLAPANKVGVIDSDYRGEIVVSLFNHSEATRVISSGDRIAQLLIVPVAHAHFTECAALEETERGAGGFGSTGAR